MHLPGTPAKFAALLPWAELNRILEQHRLEPPRLRLTREGEPVAPAAYISYRPNRRRSGQPVPRLLPTRLSEELRNGATLVLDAVDELCEPITRLAANLERMFRVRIQVNAYAGWRTSHGFDLHWDDHDVFILQIAGRKQWKVYGMTRRYPLARDVVATADPPAGPLWEGMLVAGDLLYIPRGWWHVATPLDEPTLHLTAGINNPTGADLLSWFVDRLRESEHVRRDLPHLESREAQIAYAERLREIIAGAWRPDLVAEYMAEMDATASGRTRFGLPWTATPGVLPPEGTRYEVQWNGPRLTAIQRDANAGEITIDARGRRWRFKAAAEPVLSRLISHRACSLPDLQSAAPGLEPQTVTAFVRELVANGLLLLLR